MSRPLIKFAQVMDVVSEWFGQLAMYIVVVTVVIGFYNVVARYTGRYIGIQLSSNLYIELQWYLYSLVFLFGFAYILKHGINVRVDFIFAKWPKKRKATLDFWGHLFFLVPFCIMGIYVAINPILVSWGRLPNGSWGTWEMSPDPSGLPRAPIKTMIIFAFVLLLLQTFAELVKLWHVMHGDEELVVEELGGDTPIRIE